MKAASSITALAAAALAAGTVAAANFTAVRNGAWTDAETWGGAGTPTLADDVSLGGFTVTNALPVSLSAKSLTLTGAAKLYLWGTGTSNTAQSPMAVEESGRGAAFTLTVAEGVSLSGTSQMSLGGAEADFRPQLAVGGDLGLSGTASLAVYAGFVEGLDAASEQNTWGFPASTNYYGDGALVSVGGDLTLGSGTWVHAFCHCVYGSSPRFDVAGDVSIAANAGFNARERGWRAPNGRGFFWTANWSDGHGGSHGGNGACQGSVKRTDGLAYGYAYAPFLPGSPARRRGTITQFDAANLLGGQRGGGVIRIHARGAVSLDGTLDAGCGLFDSGSGTAAGGSVWLTCASFTAGDAAAITVKGGNAKGSGTYGTGAGGRVAIMTNAPDDGQIADLYATGSCDSLLVVTTAVNDPAQYPQPTLIDVSGGEPTNTGSYTPNRGEGGTAAILFNAVGGTASLVVSVAPSADAVTLPVTSPALGRSIVSGTATATADASALVPGTDARQRRNCTGFTYSNDVETIMSGSGLSYSVDASLAANHWLEWKFDDLEYLLRVVETLGEGEVTGNDGWYDAGSTAAVTAVPAVGFAFKCWSGEVPGGYSTANPLSLEMSRPRDIKAIFVPSAAVSGPIEAVKDGEWLDAATWGGQGVPAPSSEVSISGRRVVHTIPVPIEAKSLTLEGAARLSLWGTGTANTAMSPVAMDESARGAAFALTVAEGVSLSGASQMALGGAEADFRPQLAVGGDLGLSGTASLAVYAGFVEGLDAASEQNTWGFPASTNYYGDGALVSVGGDLTLGSGTWVHAFSHGTYGSSPRFDVAGHVAIAANAGFNARNRGWKVPNGRGFLWTAKYSDGHGGSYGGNGACQGAAARTDGLAYGYASAPFLPGSPARGRGEYYTIEDCQGTQGAGAIRIHAGRRISLAGSLLADCADVRAGGNIGSASGGGVFLTCSAFSAEPGASISAHGGNISGNGTHGSGGGGRVAVVAGAPSAEQIAELYATGTCRGLRDDEASAAAYGTIVDVAAGIQNNTYVANPLNYTGEPGTAVWATAGQKATFLMLQ